MGLIGNLRDKWEISRLERLVGRDDSGAVSATLARKLAARGELGRALGVCEAGLRQFPEARSLQEIQGEIRHVQGQRELEETRRLLRDAPSPFVYARLAENHLKLGELVSALKVCEEGLKRYPDFDSIVLVASQARLERFARGGAEEDYAWAVENLERIVGENAHHYKALLLLARVYLERGEWDKAAEKAGTILFLSPDEPEAQEIRRRAGQREGAAAGAEAPAPEATAAPPPPAAAEYPLDIICALRGVTGAVVADQSGLVVEGRCAPECSEDALGAVVGSFSRKVQDTAGNVNLGSFAEGFVEGPRGRLYCVRLKSELLLGVVSDQQAKTGLVELKIREFISRA